MHELSIASAILELARQHQPTGTILRSVSVVAGPMRAIQPEAMQFAWQAVIAEAEMKNVQLDFQLLPAGDALQLTSIEVDDEVDDVAKGGVPCASQS